MIPDGVIPDAIRVRNGIAAIGRLIEDPARRRRWIAFIERLHDLASPGERLEGWVFHGTERSRATSIRFFGMETTVACVNGSGRAADRWRWTRGSHWGTAAVAAFYAEDLSESLECQILFSIVAVRLDDLVRHGSLRADGQSIDCPLWTRLGIDNTSDEHALASRWDGSRKDWRASMDYTGSLVCLAPVPPSVLTVLDDEDGLEAWMGTKTTGAEKIPGKIGLGAKGRRSPNDRDTGPRDADTAAAQGAK